MQRKNALQQALDTRFNPTHLEVIDESHQHNVPEGAESHFKVIIVSDAFAGEMLIKRHRAVNQTLGFAFEQGMHALSIHTYTPEEWQVKQGQIAASPPCLGGSKRD